jgi:hypothetical protein
MGFTLGKKEVIINTDPDGSKVGANGSVLFIKGYGTFDLTKARAIRAFRYTAGNFASMQFIGLDPDAYLKGGATSAVVTFSIEINSDRYEAEFANEMLYMGKTITVSLLIKDTMTKVDIGNAYRAALNEYLIKFGADFPFTYGPGGAGPYLTNFEMKPGYEHLSFGRFITTNSKYHKNTIRHELNYHTLPTPPQVTGKDLEENVRMSLPHTSDLYAIEADQLPVLNGKYTAVLVTMDDDQHGSSTVGYRRHKGLGGTKDERAGWRHHSFIVYLEEGGDGIVGNTAGSLLDIATAAEAAGIFTGNFFLANGGVAGNPGAWAS